jgi:glutaredoxin
MTKQKRSVRIYSKDECPWCDQARALLKQRDVSVEWEKKVGTDISKEEFLEIAGKHNWKPATVPMIFDASNDKFIGGYQDLTKWVGLT